MVSQPLTALGRGNSHTEVHAGGALENSGGGKNAAPGQLNMMLQRRLHGAHGCGVVTGQLLAADSGCADDTKAHAWGTMGPSRQDSKAWRSQRVLLLRTLCSHMMLGMRKNSMTHRAAAHGHPATGSPWAVQPYRLALASQQPLPHQHIAQSLPPVFTAVAACTVQPLPIRACQVLHPLLNLLGLAALQDHHSTDQAKALQQFGRTRDE